MKKTNDTHIKRSQLQEASWEYKLKAHDTAAHRAEWLQEKTDLPVVEKAGPPGPPHTGRACHQRSPKPCFSSDRIGLDPLKMSGSFPRALRKTEGLSPETCGGAASVSDAPWRAAGTPWLSCCVLCLHYVALMCPELWQPRSRRGQQTLGHLLDFLCGAPDRRALRDENKSQGPGVGLTQDSEWNGLPGELLSSVSLETLRKRWRTDLGDRSGGQTLGDVHNPVWGAPGLQGGRDL